MYKLRYEQPGVIRLSDGAIIPPDSMGFDWQEYMRWMYAGNDPLPADTPPAPPRPRLPKSVIVDRLTDEELETFRTAKSTFPARLVFLWDEAPNNAVNAEDTRLVEAFVTILGEERTAEVLRPE